MFNMTTTSPDVTVAESASPLIEPSILPPPMHPPGERTVPPRDEPFCSSSALTEMVKPLEVARPVHAPDTFALGLADDVDVTAPSELPEQPTTEAKSEKMKKPKATRMTVSGRTRSCL